MPVSSDASELDALVSNHYVVGRASTTLPSVSHSADDFENRLRYALPQAHANAIWVRWITDHPSFTEPT